MIFLGLGLTLRWAIRQQLDNKVVLLSFLMVLSSVFANMFLIANVIAKTSPLFNLFTLLLYVLFLCIGPTMYVYVEYLVYGGSLRRLFSRNAYAFLLPAALLVVNISSYLILTFGKPGSLFFDTTDNIVFFLNFVVLTFGVLLQNLYYIFLAVQLYRLSEDVRKQAGQQKRYHWLGVFIGSYACFLMILYLQQISAKAAADWTLLSIEIIFISWVLIKDFKREDTVPSIAALVVGADGPAPMPVKEIKEETSEPIINEELQESIIQRLENCLQENKVYRQTDLTLASLAKSIDTNDKYLRFVLSQHYNQGFIHFINQHRVEAAKRMLMDESQQIYTIESIGQTVGFNSKSSFYAAFKRLEGLTPFQFRQQFVKEA